jgi:hypothetical protein
MWARQQCCSVASSEVRSLVFIDLSGRTGLARLHPRVRFGVSGKLPALGAGSLSGSMDRR